MACEEGRDGLNIPGTSARRALIMAECFSSSKQEAGKEEPAAGQRQQQQKTELGGNEALLKAAVGLRACLTVFLQAAESQKVRKNWKSEKNRASLALMWHI